MSDCISLNYFSINPNIVYTFIDNEVVLMDEKDEVLYGMNEVATAILKCLISQPTSIQDASNYILEQFEIEEPQISLDIKNFFESLLAKNFICQAKKNVCYTAEKKKAVFES
ncbi:MAG: PqqD family protein [Coxiellaceae bacterium]|nr:PqqD family protein [Coxiellaceae bacterium]